MKKFSIRFLQGMILFLAGAVLAGLVRFPLTEGRAAGLDPVSVYTDPFILYTYLASLPFFVALAEAFRLLARIGRGEAFSPRTARALRHIRVCALLVAGFIVIGRVWLYAAMSGQEDMGGPNALSIFALLLALAGAGAANVGENLLREAGERSAVIVNEKNN